MMVLQVFIKITNQGGWKMNVDYLVVGSGLFGSTFAYEAAKRGKKVKVIERRNHIGGNVYTEQIEGIQVHRYGAHIFHTNDKKFGIM